MRNPIGIYPGATLMCCVAIALVAGSGVVGVVQWLDNYLPTWLAVTGTIIAVAALARAGWTWLANNP